MPGHDPFDLPHLRGPVVDFFMAAYWNEVDQFTNTARAALEFRRLEHPAVTARLRDEISSLLGEGAFPETIDRTSRKAYDIRFPKHHRIVTRREAEAILVSLG